MPHMSYFRPISCYNTIYKIITKVLLNRLQQVIGDLISHNQSAFLKGRSISDSLLLAHELVRGFNNPMGSRLCMKVDLKKAFDTVNREYIYYMFHCMGFSCKWTNWIKDAFPLLLFPLCSMAPPLVTSEVIGELGRVVLYPLVCLFW